MSVGRRGFSLGLGAVGLGAFAVKEPQGEVESFDFTAPAFVDRALAAGQ